MINTSKSQAPPYSSLNHNTPDSKIHGANMGPTWVLSAPGEPHVGPMDLAIRDIIACCIAIAGRTWAHSEPLKHTQLLTHSCELWGV